MVTLGLRGGREMSGGLRMDHDVSRGALIRQSRTGLGGIGSGLHRGHAGSRQSRSGGLIIARLRNWPASGSGHQRGGRGSIEKGHGLPPPGRGFVGAGLSPATVPVGPVSPGLVM